MKLMKRIILTLSLVVLSNSALAEWIEIQKFEDGMRVFVDQATASRSGDTAQVLHLVRWSEPQLDDENRPYRSTIVRTAYDCASKHEKYLASTSYAGPMGSGVKVIEDEDEAEVWYSISESSMEDKLWTIACNAK